MGGLDHTSRKHALLSASGSSRWLNCTPSARLEDKFQESGNSVYAQEGTLAHEFGELELRYVTKKITKRVYGSEIKKLRKDPLYTSEMEPQVSKYVDYVLETFSEAKAKTPDSVLLIEEKLDYSHYVEKGFGRGDSIVISDGVLDVQDLKYGKGVKVDALDNSQLKLYGLAALRAFELLYDIRTVRLTVVQPRLDHVSVFDISVEDLIEWGNKIVRPAAKKAFAGEGVQKAGDWCKWCKVKAMCATLAAKNVALAKHDFADPHLLKDRDIVAVSKQIPMLIDWANAVKSYLLKEALKGKTWPGLKLVRGKSQRRWTDEDAVIDILTVEGFEDNQFLNTKLKGIGDIQQLLGKDDFNILTKPYLIKPEGAPTLVPLSDKRPAMGNEQAKEDFKDPL